MKKILILFIWLNFFIPLQAEIIECHQFLDIKLFLYPQDMVFTEIDEVLVSSTETIASMPFLNVLKQKAMDEGLTLNQATQRLNALWSKILQKAHFQLKEENLSPFFKALQNDHISIFGFTARPFSSQLPTLMLLQQHDLHFDPFRLEGQDDILKTVLSEGLFFVSFDKRLEILDSLFLDGSLNPTRVVFADYNLMNLVQTQLYFEERKIPFLGLYFPIKNRSECDYPIQIGQIQLKYFNSILPNHIARSLIHGQ